MDKIGALKSLGLRDKEARVYIALLELGRASAYAVAQKSDLKKPTTYVVLDELIEMGYVIRLPKKGKQLFVARSPQEMFANMHGKFLDAEKILPELLALARENISETKILFYEGGKGVQDAYNYRIQELEGKEAVAFYASTVDINPSLNTFLLAWNKKAAALNISTRAIVPDHPSLKEYRKRDAEHGRTVKIVPYSQYSSSISIDANEFFTRIVMFGNEKAIVIDDPKVSKTVQQIFEMLWTLL